MSESLRDRVARVLYGVWVGEFPAGGFPSFDDAHEFDKEHFYGQSDALIAAGLVVDPRATVKIARIKSAWNDAGAVPSYHERMKRIIEHQWPVLAHAIKRAIQ